MTWEKVEKDVTKGPLGLIKWIVLFVLFGVLFFGGIRFFMMPAKMAVERVVMKNSFQYVEGMEQRAATLKASIAEIDVMMQRFPEKTEALSGQRMILSAQLRAITINQ